MSGDEPIDVTAVLDGERFGGYRIFIVGLCGVVAMLDGFDTQAIAFVAPVIATEWKMNLSAFGPIFGAGLFGLMIGALVFGPVADRFGRRTVIIVSVAVFGLFALLTAMARSLEMLLLLRFLTGLGLGGAMPNVIAITSEYSPARLRATMITVMFCGFPLGAVIGGFVGARMIPAFGWKSSSISAAYCRFSLFLSSLSHFRSRSAFLSRRVGRRRGLQTY